jgi:hypothetical protein
VGRLFLLRRSRAACIHVPALRRLEREGDPMTHKYHVRQLVRLLRPGFSDSRASTSGFYEVTRLMPADQTGEFSYRIRSSTGGERAVREGEITAHVSDN